ncbi:hypothetical protein B0H15DRAFT_832948 [Mycena belliarum]|uniref:Uncharacterized protein n=1 Tax=Mycena belliarum TaxID=1033014 RepID=A0AAD6U9L2_9AGAR|nr:hypothetical protein B0H15DRAFT_832948 [Mycena belliae]
MASQGLQICPHTCGCDVSSPALSLMSRTPEWLARCPVYEKTGTGMADHLVHEIHPSCISGCPLYTETRVSGRDLTHEEFEAWVPYIGHLDQFRPHIPAQYHHLIALPRGVPSFLPKHPLIALEGPPSAVPARYDEFFATLANKDASASQAPPKRGGTRMELGPIQQAPPISQDAPATSTRTYEGFFSSFSAKPNDASPDNPAQENSPSSSADAMAKEQRLLAALKDKPPPAAPGPRPRPSQDYASSVRVLDFGRAVPDDHSSFSATNGSGAPDADAPTVFSWRLPPSSVPTIASPAAPAPPSDSPMSWRLPAAPPPAAPPAPPPRILATTSLATLHAAVLATYAVLPGAPDLLFALLTNTATGPDGALYVVPRYQICRHCAEEFDTTQPAARCTWHYGASLPFPFPCPFSVSILTKTNLLPSTSSPGTALLDPQWATYAAGPSTDPQRLYFWDCCGARLSARAPGCLASAHAPLAPPNGPPMRLPPPAQLVPAPVSALAAPPGGKRKRAGTRVPEVRCGHCGTAWRTGEKDKEKDGMSCAWHDGVRVVAPGEVGVDARSGGRWSCCGQDGGATGCVVSAHVPPRVLGPRDQL